MEPTPLPACGHCASDIAESGATNSKGRRNLDMIGAGVRIVQPSPGFKSREGTAESILHHVTSPRVLAGGAPRATLLFVFSLNICI